MCGIAGYISDEKLNAAEMLNVLKHRGPDHHAGYSDYNNSKEIFLGHTRLSILDLSSNGNQPMLSDDKQIILVFNGEIYNFQELKLKYFKHDIFHSRTDTEVLLKLYQKFGIAFINELNGDFAFSIYDKKLSKVFLIKDHIGVKPLYYYTDGKKFIFGSEIKTILAAGIKPSLAEDELLNYFVFKYTPKNNTLYKKIYRVPPASYIEYNINTNSFLIHQYWSLQKNKDYAHLSYTDAQSVLKDLIEQSIKSRLISDVPIANFLSGGLDSSIIAYFIKSDVDIIHYCARKTERDLKKEGTSSDYFYADKLSKEWGLDLQQANIGSDEANLHLIKKTLYYSDDLIADGSQIPSYLITKEASKTSKVILSGMGADELFLGYAGHLLTLLSENVISQFPHGISSGLYKQAAKVNQGKGRFLAYRRYIHKIGKYGNYPNYKLGILNLVGDFENSSSVYPVNRDKLENMLSNYFPENEDVFDSLTRFEIENVLVKNLNYTDRTAMANSVECRVPFLDKAIVEFAFSIKRNYKLSNTATSKRILKDAFALQLPEYIIKRRKAGFGMPLRSIFSSHEKVNQLLDKSFFSNFNHFSIPNIENIIMNHISGKEDNSSIIYALISFQEWYKMRF
jgi:asparagine synthase (glutamine-hydrolysing)